MKGRPLVSIVMPAYNAGSTISETIQSILEQSYSIFEFIIINDGSTDNTTKIINKFANKDKRIKIIYNSKNLGTVVSLNKGLKIAKGKYIARIDADDLAYKNRFKIQVSFLEKNTDVFLCSSNATLIISDGSFLGKTNHPTPIENYLSFNNVIVSSTVMFRNRFHYYYRVKFIGLAEDYDLWLRMLSDNRKMVLINQCLIKYRILLSGTSLSNSKLPYLMYKAQSYYYERIKYGKDNYRNLQPFKFFPKGHRDNAFAKKGYLWTLLSYDRRDVATKYFNENFHLKEVGLRLWITYSIFLYIPFSLKITQNLLYLSLRINRKNPR